jgi:hypothetical protein
MAEVVALRQRAEDAEDANAVLDQRVRDAETARNLAWSDLRGVLGTVELGLDASELAA